MSAEHWLITVLMVDAIAFGIVSYLVWRGRE